ncbi:MAG: PAS domain S-box protein [Leptolyngbya sp. SIO1D8]|nr:PAS domain S-box protein [Leptolyngbya sp. SIO1D8]
MFVGQIIGAVGLVGYLSFRNGQKAVNDLATQLRHEVTARIERELRGYFETPHEINRLNAGALALGLLDLNEAQFGEGQLYQQMKISPNVALVYCGSAQKGEFFGVLRSPEDGSLQLSYSNQSTNYLRRFYSLDVRGERTHFLRQTDKPYDSRQRPWFTAATLAEQPAWTDIYIAFTTGLPNITASLPVYNRSGRNLIGVCATDVVLPEEFRAFLQQMEIGSTGQAFVVDRQGHLISNSTDEPLMQESGEVIQPLLAINSQDPLVQKTANYLTERFNGFEQITQAQQLEFQINYKRQFLEVVPFQDDFGLDWLIVVVVPEADFMAQINTNTRNTVLLCAAALLLAIGISVVTARWITRPILRVSRASDKLAQGNLDQQVEPSFITEIDTLGRSFNDMTEQLQQSFTALQQSEATNRAIVNTIPDLMIRARDDGTYLDIIGSDRLRGVYGVQQFSLGKTVKDSLPPELAEQRMYHIQQALQTGKLQVYEHRIVLNGRSQDEEVRILVLGENEVLIMVRDISDRKEAEAALRVAEENYRSIFEHALEGIFQSSPEGHFINVNPALARIYGYASPTEMLESITDIGEQLYVDSDKRAEFQELLVQQNTVKNFEYRSYRKDRSIIWVQIDARAVRNHDQLLYYEGIVQDVTQRKRVEKELRRQLEELKIEIDQKKRDEEVATLTASRYFQEVQEEIDNVNLDEFWQ